MSGGGVLILFGLSCVLSACYGTLYPPLNMTRLTYLNGSTARISWTYDGVTTIFGRVWYFKSSDGSPEEAIASLPPQKLSSSLPRVSAEEPATLILKNVTKKYNGMYKFILNAVGGGESSVVVYIAVTPSVSVNCSRVNTRNTSDNFSCVCRGEDGNPPANVSWYKGNEIVATGIEEAKLQVSNVTKDDNGSYTCVAKSHEKAKNETEIDLIVVLKPNVTTNCSNPVVKEGADFICPCECKDGNPPAKCTWYRNGAKIGEIGLQMNTLTLRNVGEQDRGKYTCVGQSHTARDEKSIKVTVLFKPRNTKIKFSMNSAVINETVNVTCTSDGFPEPSYTFFHNNSKLNSSGNRYVIYNVTSEDAGTYNCTANNTEGSDSNSDFLNVIAEPKPISSTIMASPSIMASPTTPAPASSSTLSSIGKDGDNEESSEESNIAGLAGGIGGGAGVLLLLLLGVFYYKSKKRDNKSDINPNGSRVISNYEMEEEAIDGNAYDTVKPPDSGEGSQKKEKPPGDTLPPVYAAVDKNNRDGNSLYASLDSEALNRPGSTKKQPETPKAPATEYASIDFMKTAKTPNDDSVST